MSERRAPDVATLAGLAVAAAGIIGGQLLEGGRPGSLVQGAGFAIVFFGTLGAVMVQTRFATFREGLRMGWWAVMPPPPGAEALIREVAVWSAVMRREGLLGLERVARAEPDPFRSRALQLLADGIAPAALRDALEVEVIAYEERLRHAARIWESAGGYAPTVGILGAVLGLIQVMENLSDPTRLGPGIAVAFVATVYGVGLANLVFLPISNKLKALIAQQVTVREMLIDGLAALAEGENPRLVLERLRGYLA